MKRWTQVSFTSQKTRHQDQSNGSLKPKSSSKRSQAVASKKFKKSRESRQAASTLDPSKKSSRHVQALTCHVPCTLRIRRVIHAVKGTPTLLIWSKSKEML